MKKKNKSRTFTAWVYCLTGLVFIAVPVIDALAYKPHLSYSQVFTTNWPQFLVGALCMVHSIFLTKEP